MKFMDSYLLLVGIFLISIEQTLQLTSNINKNGNKYPTYSLENMPKTSFTCRDKILGGYYADPETQCQMFHVCVKIAGVGIQNFRFLCPNATAFDQEAQTCADFGDVDCEQATLYYGSDNFDLYRIGSGFEHTKHPTPATEDESTFHLQRAESNDIRRSKQQNSVQNALYNFGSSFNQYQPQKQTTTTTSTTTTTTTTTTPRNILATRKSLVTTTSPYFAVKANPLVLAPANSNNNDEIFKGSHSSNFYSNRNSNDDDDDYKRSSIANTSKSRHRSRGRAHYRGTPATTTSTTFKPPVVQNYTTLTPFTTKSTTLSPFKFTFSSTVRANPSLSHVANQINSTPLGPLQQQYQHPNYNDNNFNSFKIQPTTTTTVPTSSTQKNSFRTNIFNNLVTTQPSAFNALQRQVVSVPTPFNNNHINAKKFEGTNANDKSIISNGAFANNNNIYNANLYSQNATNSNRPTNGRVFDNHNVINNYQTTSPFANQRTIANHLTTNNTVLRLAPTQANSFGSQNAAFNVQKPANNSFYQPNPHLITTVQPPTTTQSRNSLSQYRPNFNQQDLINQFNSEQQKPTQQNPPPNNPSVPSKQRSDAQAYLSLEQKRLQLHYDINDYLTTDKYTTSKYSPTSEHYRSVQSVSNANSPHTSQSNQLFTQRYQDPLFTTTPKINKQSFEINYNQPYQTQQDRPSQVSNNQYNFNSQINTTPQPVIPKQTSTNSNSFVSTSTKKFSTLVPKENYAPTTFKPQFYFSVAKQINDNLSTPSKPKAVTDNLITTSTARTNHIDPIFNRNPNLSQFNFRGTPSNKQESPVQTSTTVNTNVAGIDENDGQYHPELYEKDFARYKIKSRKKQQQVIQNSLKQNFGKPQNDFNNINRGGQKSFGSAEEEFLNTAHSQNIAASGNELWAHSKNLAKSKQSYSIPSKATTVSPNKSTTVTAKSTTSISKDDKDVSYDYAYYDSANDAPHDYSEFDLPDFGKTQRQ